jgi:hypothetical protein
MAGEICDGVKGCLGSNAQSTGRLAIPSADNTCLKSEPLNFQLNLPSFSLILRDSCFPSRCIAILLWLPMSYWPDCFDDAASFYLPHLPAHFQKSLDLLLINWLSSHGCTKCSSEISWTLGHHYSRNMALLSALVRLFLGQSIIG